MPSPEIQLPTIIFFVRFKNYIILFLCMCACMYTYAYVCGGRRTTLGSQFYHVGHKDELILSDLETNVLFSVLSEAFHLALL